MTEKQKEEKMKQKVEYEILAKCPKCNEITVFSDSLETKWCPYCPNSKCDILVKQKT